MTWSVPDGAAHSECVEEYSPAIRRVCMAVDVEWAGGPGVRELAAARHRMSALITDMCHAAGFGTLPHCQQGAESGEVVVLPVGIDEPQTLTLIVTWLARALHQADAIGDGPRIRLRVAVHEGIAALEAGEFDGPAIRKAGWLLAARPLRAALASRPGANLAVLFSGRIHEDLGWFDGYLPPEEFTPVVVSDPSARTQETGWLLVPEGII
jgi:hypothetical protein